MVKIEDVKGRVKLDITLDKNEVCRIVNEIISNHPTYGALALDRLLDVTAANGEILIEAEFI